MLNLNKVFLLGNLTRDPELRYAPNGTAIVSFGLATNRRFKSAEGEQKKEVCFVDISMFGRRAEVISEYFSKGSSIYVEGRLKYEQWESQDGQKRNKLAVIAENFEFVGASQKGGSSEGDGDFKEDSKVNYDSVKPGPDSRGDNNGNIDDNDVPF